MNNASYNLALRQIYTYAPLIIFSTVVHSLIAVQQKYHMSFYIHLKLKVQYIAYKWIHTCYKQ